MFSEVPVWQLVEASPTFIFLVKKSSYSANNEKEKKKKHKSLNYPARGALQQIWMEKAETFLPRSIAEKYSPASLPA